MSITHPAGLHWPRQHRWRLALIASIGTVGVILLWMVLALLRPKHEAPPATPVTSAEAKEGAVQIILRGLGQVQAFNTYTAKSRVDGNITVIGFKEGTRVKAGDLLVQIDPRPYSAALEQAEAIQARDAAQLANARLDLQRYAQLLPEGLTTKQTHDTQAATVKQLEATVKSDAAQTDEARVNLGYTEIRAPFAGRTGQRLIDIGNLISASSQTALVVLTQTQPIFVNFTLPELDLGRIVDAMHRGSVKVEAFDSDDAHLIASGTLTVLDNTVDPGSGTVRLKAQFNNAGEQLWPGEFVNAHVVVAVRQRGISIPAAAVQMGPNGRFVFRVGRDGKAQVVPVTLGQIENNMALIDRGLKPRDRVIVDGAFGLSAGDPVRVTGRARPPQAQGTLDMTGRTADVNNSDNNNAGAGDQNGVGGNSQTGATNNTGKLPTARQLPQPQTAPPGQELNGKEGPGARMPLPDQRQVPEQPSSKSSGSGQQQPGGGNGQ